MKTNHSIATGKKWQKLVFPFLIILTLITLNGYRANAQCRTNFGFNPDSSGYSLQFFDSSTGGIPTAWAWNFGDGATSTLQSPSHTYAASGFYQVCLTVSFSGGCTATYCDSVFAGPQVAPCTADFSYNVTSGTGTVLFTDLSSGGSAAINSWSWDFGDGSTSNLASPVHTYSNSGNYFVCLNITTAGGMCTNTSCSFVLVQMTQPCTAYFGFSVLASQFNVSFFDTSYTGTGNIISWSWDFGDSTTSNLQNPNHTYPGPGSYQVCLTITTSTGCSSTYCDRVDFLSTSCQAGFGNYGANPLQITFVDYSTSSSGTITGWTWDFGDGGSSTQSNPVHSYAAGGYYPVCLTISTTTGCMDTYCETIYVATTTSCQSSFTFQTNGSVVNFQDNSIPLNHISVWDFGDGNTVTQWNGQLVSHQYLSTGTYAVCLTITDSLCWSTSCDTIVITQSGCSAQFSSSTDSISPMNVWFTDQSVGAITNWLWDFGDGASSTIANPAHTYASVGTYRVCLTVVDTINQCSNTFCQNVYAISPCAPYFGAYPDSLIQTGVDMIFWTQSPCGTPTAIFWDFGDGTYDSTGVLNPVHTYADTGTYTVCECVVIGVDTFCNCQPVYAYRISSDIDELSSPVRSLTASPNPFRENAEIQFELSQEGNVELSVVDILGNQIEAIYKGHAAGGSHIYSVSGRGLSPGIYFIRLQVNGFAKTQKIFFLP